MPPSLRRRSISATAPLSSSGRSILLGPGGDGLSRSGPRTPTARLHLTSCVFAAQRMRPDSYREVVGLCQGWRSKLHVTTRSDDWPARIATSDIIAETREKVAARRGLPGWSNVTTFER